MKNNVASSGIVFPDQMCDEGLFTLIDNTISDPLMVNAPDNGRNAFATYDFTLEVSSPAIDYTEEGRFYLNNREIVY